MLYHDSIYGSIELSDLTEDIVKSCPELIRLKYIGMMNFKSLNMLSLTNVSRLEHTVGLAYLAQIFCINNNVHNKNEIITAALYHDVNCTPFGHAIEWAINRYTSYEHELKSSWIVDKNIVKQIFYDQDGIRKIDFESRYSISLENVYKIINGNNCFYINNSGIDLDNIDNVYRMAMHLGILSDEKNIPILLVNSLKIKNGYDNFVVRDKYLHLVEHWHSTRSKIYNLFIYSKEYFSYEHLLFKLVSEYVKTCQDSDLENLWVQTDETLITSIIQDSKKYSKTIKDLAKKLLLFDIDNVYTLVRTEDFEKKDSMFSPGFQEIVENKINTKYAAKQNINSDGKKFFEIHITTDDRKTKRRINIYVESSNAEINMTKIGSDAKYIVIGVIGREQLSASAQRILGECLVESLIELGVGAPEIIPFYEEELSNNMQLGLFNG